MVFINSLKGYKVVLTLRAEKDLKKIEKVDAEKIGRKLEELVKGVQNLDIKKLEGKENPTYRLRSGDYRIIYTIEKHIVTVLVIEIKHRREVYRD